MDDYKVGCRVFWWLSATFAGISLFCLLTAVWSDFSIQDRLILTMSGVMGLAATIPMVLLSKEDW